MVEYSYVTKKREEVSAYPERGMGFARFMLRQVTKLQVSVYRMSKGRMMNKFVGGFSVCIVTTTGAKSGAERRIALIHLPHGDNKLLVASQGGMDKMPAWFYNVRANPEVKIQYGAVEARYTARRVSDEEKAELWPHLCSLYADFDEYQARTDRNIPVFSCERGS
jgi:deazaflavin-dependent oxidoreductase (nitroreductase family)